MVPSLWKYIGAFLNWSCLTALCFRTVSFTVPIIGLQTLGLWQVRSMQRCAESPQTVPYPANLLLWALQGCIHQHSAVRPLNDFFFFLVIAHPWTESFPEDLKQIPILVSQILFATSSMLTLKLDPLSTLVRSFVDGTVPTWDHQLWPAKHHHVLTLTLLRAINDGATIAFSNSRHYVRLKRKLIYKYHETYVTATFHKNYTKWNKYHTDYFFK